MLKARLNGIENLLQGSYMELGAWFSQRPVKKRLLAGLLGPVRARPETLRIAQTCLSSKANRLYLYL